MTALLPRPLLRSLVLMLPLLALLPGCATQQHAQQSVIWASRGQFVKVVEREQGDRAAANQQPVSLSSRKLRAELASLQVKLSDTAKPIPIFSQGELENLSAQIPDGLRQARPDQDLVFAIIGEVPHLMGLAHNNVVTTGRVFYQDNRLNLILGLTREPIHKELDMRLQPFTPGSRLQASEMPGPVTTTSRAVAFAANRPDWITMIVPEGAPEPQVPAAEAQPENKAEVPVPAPVFAPAPTAAPAPAHVAAPAAATISPAKPEPTKQERGIEERLRILGDLKAKGLITEEEFRAKKESILKEL